MDTLEIRLSNRQNRYLDWMSAAPDMRVPRSEIARMLGVTEADLDDWESKKSVKAAMEARNIERLSSGSRLADILDVLYTAATAKEDQAIEGDIQAARLWIDVTKPYRSIAIHVEADDSDPTGDFDTDIADIAKSAFLAAEAADMDYRGTLAGFKQAFDALLADLGVTLDGKDSDA